MKTQKIKFFIDKIISKYHQLTKKEKYILNFCLGLFLVIIILGIVYDVGKLFGALFYNITH